VVRLKKRRTKNAKEIDLEEWRRRGPLKKLTENVSALFAEQY
jgi:hypothetical protein